MRDCMADVEALALDGGERVADARPGRWPPTPSLEISRRGWAERALSLSASSRSRSSMIGPSAAMSPPMTTTSGSSSARSGADALGESRGHGRAHRRAAAQSAPPRCAAVVELVDSVQHRPLWSPHGGWRQRSRQELAGPGPALERAELVALRPSPWAAVDDEIEVADVAGVVRRATIELTVQHDAGADALAPVDEHEGVLGLRGSPRQRSPLRRELDVVVEVDRAGRRARGGRSDERIAGRLGHARDERDEAGDRVDDAGGGDGDVPDRCRE